MSLPIRVPQNDGPRPKPGEQLRTPSPSRAPDPRSGLVPTRQAAWRMCGPPHPSRWGPHPGLAEKRMQTHLLPQARHEKRFSGGCQPGPVFKGGGGPAAGAGNREGGSGSRSCGGCRDYPLPGALTRPAGQVCPNPPQGPPPPPGQVLEAAQARPDVLLSRAQASGTLALAMPCSWLWSGQPRAGPCHHRVAPSRPSGPRRQHPTVAQNLDRLGGLIQAAGTVAEHSMGITREEAG